MRISELARLTGVSIRSLRHYELKGLIKPQRLENSYRDYDEAAIEQVRVIQLYLGLGLNTDEIGRIKNCIGLCTQKSEHYTCNAGLLRLYEQKMQAIDDEMRVLSSIKARLLGRIRYLQEVQILPLQEQSR
jgi:DNA-binding transcriptional MerR regulator